MGFAYGTGELRLITPPLARELASQIKNLGGISFWRELVSEIWKTPGELAIFHLKKFRAPSAREKKLDPFLVDFPLQNSEARIFFRGN